MNQIRAVFLVGSFVFLAAACKGPSAPTPTPVPVNPISTLAGTGLPGFAGDGGAATSAQLDNPLGVVVGPTSTVYISDSYNNVVRSVTPKGIISTVAGTPGVVGTSGDGGAAGSAQLFSPGGLALDGSGNLYLTDTGNQRVRKVVSGTINLVSVTPLSPASLYNPTGVVVDSAGILYVADSGNHRILKVSGTTTSTFAGTGTSGFSGDGAASASAQLSLPTGVALDSTGNLYIADAGNNRVRKVTKATGFISTLAGNGTSGYSGDGGAATSAELNYPAAVALDSSGNLFISDTGNNVVRKVAVSTGVITTYAGNGTAGSSGDGGAAAAANLNSPGGVFVDSSGNLYIADSGNHKVRLVGP